MAKGMKTLDKLIEKKLDKLDIIKWAEGASLWARLRELLGGK